MRMRPACELDGEIYGEAFSGVETDSWTLTGHPSLASIAAAFMSLLVMSLLIHVYKDGSQRHP